MNEKKRIRWNKLAVASLICGVLNLGGLDSILATCFGYMAKKQSKESNRTERGLPLATIGMSLGGLALVWDKFFDFTPRYKEQLRRAVCFSNLQKISEALYLYAVDYDGHPPLELTTLYPKYISNPTIFWCPSDEDPPPSDIISNEIDAENSARISYQYNPAHKEGDSFNSFSMG